MKRDMDAIRSLLLWMEEQPVGIFGYHDLPPLPDGMATIEYVQMLKFGGYLAETQRGFFRITWEGHELLDKMRDEEIWAKTKAGASKVGSWSVKLLGELASGLIRQKAVELGLPLG